MESICQRWMPRMPRMAVSDVPGMAPGLWRKHFWGILLEHALSGSVEGSATCVLKSAGIKTGVWASKIRVSQELWLPRGECG